MRATASPASGLRRLLVVVAVVPGGIGVDGLAAHLAERDEHGTVLCSGGQRNRRPDSLRMIRRPFQHLHTAHGTAGDRQQSFDAEVIDELDLGAHHIADGHHREVQPVALAGRRDLCWTGRLSRSSRQAHCCR